MTEDRGQMTDDREQMTDDKGQKAKGREAGRLERKEDKRVRS
jgi:hypothetical protein